MKILVMKFGGTSVADIKKLKNVAIKVKRNSKKYKVVVVLSAMAGETNKLQKYLDIVSEKSSYSSDLVITSGEHVSVGLLSIILNKLKVKSICLLGWQIPIITDNSYGKARILKINNKIIKNYFKKNEVIIVPGFQGISKEGKISSLGRGGSDTTAVALACSLKATRCDIYTDVDGVYSTDPNIDKKAKKIKKISYEEMLEMASLGAKVLQTRSVELAMKNNLVLQVLSSLNNSPGTFIVNEKNLIEKEMVTGISYTKNEAKITISGIPDKPGVSSLIFGILSDSNINVDMIVQNISQDGLRANVTFTVQEREMNLAKKILEKNRDLIDFHYISTNADVSKVSVIGVGMKSQSGVAKKMFKALADLKINILAISTSEIKISVLINRKMTNKAVKKLHKAYVL
ncbi:MAG: Aspartate kinase [Alphaproteobacteria bacterium MarineAlpha5_Bin9]|nr:MAG: Aspartate kinase [Alphaproteobacteria bacterium MarineAlpha5_Bin9]